METLRHMHVSAAGTPCFNCGSLIKEPEYSFDFFEEAVVVNLWWCAACGNHFEADMGMDEIIREKSEELYPQLLAA